MSEHDQQQNPFAAPSAPTDRPTRPVADDEIRLTAGDWLMAIISALFVLVLGEMAAVSSTAFFVMLGLPHAVAALLTVLCILLVPVLEGLNVWMSLRRAREAKRKKLSLQKTPNS